MKKHEVNDLMQYLNEFADLDKLAIEDQVREIYRNFYVFLDPDSSQWWSDFIVYCKQKAANDWIQFLSYIKTVDFLHYRQTLEKSLI